MGYKYASGGLNCRNIVPDVASPTDALCRSRASCAVQTMRRLFVVSLCSCWRTPHKGEATSIYYFSVMYNGGGTLSERMLTRSVEIIRPECFSAFFELPCLQYFYSADWRRLWRQRPNRQELFHPEMQHREIRRCSRLPWRRKRPGRYVACSIFIKVRPRNAPPCGAKERHFSLSAPEMVAIRVTRFSATIRRLSL